jgi:hypothetical protein
MEWTTHPLPPSGEEKSMCTKQHHVSLGFAEQQVPVGTHMCMIYTTEEERVGSLQKFLLSGLTGGERTACFSDKTDEQSLRDFLATHDMSYDECTERGAITLSGTGKHYFKDGAFSPDHMLGLISAYYRDSLAGGFRASRIIGEMNSDVQRIPGGERLLEYESRVSILVRDEPVTAVCQYDANAFDGASLMEILRVHPKMIINGSVVHNPFFVEPEEYLRRG